MVSCVFLTGKIESKLKLCICLITINMVTGCSLPISNNQQAIENARIQFEAGAQARKEVNDKAIDAIFQAEAEEKVQLNWIRPVTVTKELNCTIKAELAPDGTVISTEVISSSGHEIFDRSAKEAVHKASNFNFANGYAKKFMWFNFTNADQVNAFNKAQELRNNAEIQEKINKEQVVAQKNHEALVLKEYDRQLKSGRYPFVAELSCAYAGQLAHPNSCFHPNMYDSGTTFELKNGDFYKMYQYHDLGQAGVTIDNVLHIPLEQPFKITAQNSDTFALLNLKIKDSITGKIIFEKSAGYFRVISVRN